MFRDIVYTRLSLSHCVDVFQWDRQCSIIWIVKLQSRFFLMSIDKFSTHAWTTNLLFCSPFCRRLRFQRHLLTQSLLPLWMMVLDDWKVLGLRLHTEICNLLLRILLGFWHRFLRLLILAHLHSLVPSNHLTNLTPHVAHSLNIFLKEFVV